MSQPQRIHNFFGRHNTYIDYTHLYDKNILHFLSEKLADSHALSFNVTLNCRIKALHVILIKSYKMLAVFLPFCGQSDKLLQRMGPCNSAVHKQ